jgi:hypothetical protein
MWVCGWKILYLSLANAHVYAPKHKHTQTHTQTHTRMFTRTHAHQNTITRERVQPPCISASQAPSLCTRSISGRQTDRLKSKRTQTHRHTHTHTHTHTHKYAHAQFFEYNSNKYKLLQSLYVAISRFHYN